MALHQRSRPALPILVRAPAPCSPETAMVSGHRSPTSHTVGVPRTTCWSHIGKPMVIGE